MAAHQVILLAPPLLLLTLWLAWLTRPWRRMVRLALGAAWLAGAWLTFGVGTPPDPSPMLLGSASSDELWTFTLQSPTQRIERLQPLDGYVSDASLLARYVWEASARPASAQSPYVIARVNGVALEPRVAAPDPDDFWCCSLRWRVPAAMLALAPVARLEIWMPARDPRVRFIAQRNPGAARLGVEGSRFFDGGELVPGVPHTHSGSVRPGFAHVWLEPGG